MAMHDQDLALARRLMGGERDAFDTFFGQNFSRLYRFVLCRVEGDADAAQDLCQQVLERAMRKMGSYRGEASLFTWLCQIARHQLADHWEQANRDQQRHVSIDQDATVRHALESLEVTTDPSPDSEREQSELRLLIQSVLDHLPPSYGDALEWKYVEGMDADAIGQRLGISAMAAHSLLARARRAFRSEFEAIAAGSV
jgi:RNA polymerase sigma-70 factor, ECF subfamily